jgi:hypothetical protein
MIQLFLDSKGHESEVIVPGGGLLILQFMKETLIGDFQYLNLVHSSMQKPWRKERSRPADLWIV